MHGSGQREVLRKLPVFLEYTGPNHTREMCKVAYGSASYKPVPGI